jgi:hypothetical protein
MWATYVIFQKTAQRKQSPIGRKFAQSGHPDYNAPITTFSGENICKIVPLTLRSATLTQRR